MASKSARAPPGRATQSARDDGGTAQLVLDGMGPGVAFDVLPTVDDSGAPGYADAFLRRFPGSRDIHDVGDYVLKQCGGLSSFVAMAGKMLRRAYDEVIDMPRTGRWSLSQLEKTEKTYIGTKVEILLRNELGCGKGAKLDLYLDQREVDVKHTLASNWSIPREAEGEICMLVRGSDDDGIFSLGLLRTNNAFLNQGCNQDGKRTINQTGMNSIFWLAKRRPLPENFFLSLPGEIRDAVLGQRPGNARVAALFRNVRRRAVRRDVVEGLAMQRDGMRRLRSNGGARDILLREGIYLLSGNSYGVPLMRAGVEVPRDSFISFSEEELAALDGGEIARLARRRIRT